MNYERWKRKRRVRRQDRRDIRELRRLPITEQLALVWMRDNLYFPRELPDPLTVAVEAAWCVAALSRDDLPAEINAEVTWRWMTRTEQHTTGASRMTVRHLA